MILYILRHAEAESSRTSDAARALTPEGLRQAARVGEFCARQGIRPELILSSPYRRTVQTADAVAAALAGGAAVQKEQFLASGMEVQAAWRELGAYGWARSLMIVGHQPDLGQLAASLLGIADAGGIAVGKATLIGLEAQRLAPYGGWMQFYLPVEMM